MDAVGQAGQPADAAARHDDETALKPSRQPRHPRVVVTLAIAAGLVFAGVAVHEFN